MTFKNAVLLSLKRINNFYFCVDKEEDEEEEVEESSDDDSEAENPKSESESKTVKEVCSILRCIFFLSL